MAATIAVMLMEAIIIAVVIFGEVLTLIVVTIVTIIMTTIKVVAEGGRYAQETEVWVWPSLS